MTLRIKLEAWRMGEVAEGKWQRPILEWSLYLGVAGEREHGKDPSKGRRTRRIWSWRKEGGDFKRSIPWSLSKTYLGDGSVQFSYCRVWLFATPWIAARQASLSITNYRSLLKLMPIELVIPSSHLILCGPLLLLPPVPPSIRVFSSESALCMRWPKYWSLSFSISPSNEHPGLICFRMDWLDLLALQGTLKTLFQHHSSKASIFWRSAFFMVQLSHPNTTPGKTIALT